MLTHALGCESSPALSLDINLRYSQNLYFLALWGTIEGFFRFPHTSPQMWFEQQCKRPSYISGCGVTAVHQWLVGIPNKLATFEKRTSVDDTKFRRL